MGAVKPRGTLSLILAGSQGLPADRWVAPSTSPTAPQFRQRPAIQLVPTPSRMQAGPVHANDTAAKSSSKDPEPDLRWLGSLVCMVTAVASASTLAWILF